MNPTALIVGASSGVGRQAAEQLAARGYRLVLCARSLLDLEAISKDLNLRFNTQAYPIKFDLLNAESEVEQILDFSIQSMGSIEHLYIFAGQADDRDKLAAPKELIEPLFKSNATGPMGLISSILQRKSVIGLKSITVCSSIAAGVPRSNNPIYAAAKRALESFMTSMRHAFEASGIQFVTVRLGYVETGMSFGKKLLLPSLTPEKAAMRIVEVTESRFSGVIYIPCFWRLIVLILNCLPWKIYSRLRF